MTTTDGVRILRLAAGLDGACPTGACDVDGDGRVSVTDAVLALRRAADLPVAACGAGSIAGRLLVPPAPASAVSEREPNDGPGTAAIVGWIAPGDVRRLTGTIDDDDPFDGWVFVADRALALDLTLTFAPEPDVDLDLLIDDRRGASATCEHTMPGRERCRVEVARDEPAPFDVVVVPAAGSRRSAYTLDVRAAVSHVSHGIVAGAGAGAAIDVEPAVYRGERAAIASGELVVQLAPESARTATDPATMTTQVVAAAHAVGLGDQLETTIAAPDGTLLVTLPEVRASAATRATAPVAALAAKRARAAARARTREAVAMLATDPRVRIAEPNRIVRAARVPRDPLYPRQWHLGAIGLPRAWDLTIGSAATVVAVVDTGIRSDHPDFAGRLVPGFDFISDPTRANDGDGLDPDPFDPGDRPESAAGGSFHGTHVAGTIAATTDNPLGVAGVTWRTAVMPLRVLGVGGGTLFDVAQAIRFAVRLPNDSGTVPPVPARIINLSLTTSEDDPVLRNAIDDATAAGALAIAAAGNTGQDGFLSPAAYPNVLAVAATDRLGAVARYSSFGAAVDLAAPGGDTHRDRDLDGFPDGILSTLRPGDTDYGLLQGTSMASAHASGVAALLLGIPGGASAERLREVLIETAEDGGPPGRDDHYGAGIIDAARAVRTLAGLAPPARPLLSLASAVVDVATDESVLRVPFRNDGGATLVLGAPTVATENGLPWLAATIDGSALRLEVDRDALAAGAHPGRVTIDSNGGGASLTVFAEVDAKPPEDIGPVTILLRDAATRAIVTTTTTTAADAYRYRFTDVAPGRYEIVASTDRDADGAICDVGESCGAYPNRNQPESVPVSGGITLRARDFALQLVVSTSETVP